MNYTAFYQYKDGTEKKMENDDFGTLSRAMNNIAKLGLVIGEWFITDNRFGGYAEIGHGRS